MSDQRRRINDLFNDAIERPENERRSFVVERAGSDVELLSEVLSLLDSHHRVSPEFLEEPAARLVEPSRPSLEPGSQIGNYRIERELGQGGMGIVYLAEDLRLGRKVALKAIAPSFSHDEKRRERLRKEARAAARLSHAGIATVFALEEIDGDLYIACEYVPGRTLRAELEDGEMGVDRVLDVAARLARALEAAHAQQVVHRDLKPENVVSTTDGGVKILDFGVARLVEPFDRASMRLTEAGMLVGTPAYMSPEQVEGKEVDSRSDVFSFGVMLYELATGVHPFEGTSQASTIGRIMAADPSSLKQVRPALPAELDRIVRKCLRKRPEERYQSTADLALDLEHLAGRRRSTPSPAAAAAAPAQAAAIRWWRVHQVSVAFVYAVMSAFAWLATGRVKSDWTQVLFFVYVGAAALNGTLRVHLLFTQRHNVQAFRGELRRARPWLRGSDILIGAGLAALGLVVGRAATPLAIALASVGAGSIIASLAAEPATTDAAFPRRQSGVRRATPRR